MLLRNIRRQFFLLFLSLCIASPLYAQRDITIGYQGVIESQGEFLNDTTGFFRFALCSEDCSSVYWSNDGTSISGSQPSLFLSQSA